MNYITKSTVILLSILVFSTVASSQKNVKVRLEEVQEKCKGVTQDKKVRVAVSRFNVTTPSRGGEFGENMATMLTNALQQTNCYRVLAQLKNLGDLKGELDFNKSENSSGEDGPEKGKMMAAQLVVTGEITEYSLQNKDFGVGIFKSKSKIAKIGFVLQIINPETRELISKSINVEGKIGGGVKVGVHVPVFGDINAGSGSNEDPAVANALEQGIIEAIEFMSAEKEKIALLAPLNTANGTTKTTIITIKNTDFGFLSSLSESLKTATGVSDVQKKLADGTGTITIKHAGTTDELMTEITKKSGDKVSITDYSEGKITLKMK